MMMRVHFFAIAAFCLIVLTGCGVLSAPAYQQTKQYDIALPEPVKERDYSVRIQALAGDSAGRFKMIYRNGTEIEQDEFNRWSLPPAAMISLWSVKIISPCCQPRKRIAVSRYFLPIWSSPGQILSI